MMSLIALAAANLILYVLSIKYSDKTLKVVALSFRHVSRSCGLLVFDDVMFNTT